MAPEAEEFQVPLEAFVFLVIVGVFVVLLFVFFLYLNKSLCFTKCSRILPWDSSHPDTAEFNSKKLSGTFDYADPDDTSSDSDDEVLRRYQQTMVGPRPSNVGVANRGGDRRKSSSVNEGTGGPNKTTTGIATYLRRDEDVRNYNSEGNTDAFSSQATTKFIVGDPGDPGDLGDDPVVETEPENRSCYGENGTSATVSSDEQRQLILRTPDSVDDSGAAGPSKTGGGEAYENRAFREQKADGFEKTVRAAEDRRVSAGRQSNQGASVTSRDTVSNIDHEEHLFDVGDLDDRDSVVLISKCGNVSVTFHYQPAIGRMTLTIHEARDIPSKDRGGAHNTQVRLLLLPTKKTRHKTKIKPGDCPKFEETFNFKVPIDELNNMGVRIRLYGCERMRREIMIGETVKGFATLPLDNPIKQWLALEPRSNLSHGDSKVDIASLTRSDSGSSGQSMQHGGMPELLIGLSYNGMTGRLSVQVIKGSNFKNMAMARAPDTYVKLTMMSPNGQEISRSKTSIRRGQPHPLYKETFMFQVPLFQLPDVTLMVSVFYNRSIKRKEMIGWFSLGYSNSSEEELSHWNDMRESKDEEVCRWHVLLEP